MILLKAPSYVSVYLEGPPPETDILVDSFYIRPASKPEPPNPPIIKVSISWAYAEIRLFYPQLQECRQNYLSFYPRPSKCHWNNFTHLQYRMHIERGHFSVICRVCNRKQ